MIQILTSFYQIIFGDSDDFRIIQALDNYINNHGI